MLIKGPRSRLSHRSPPPRRTSGSPAIHFIPHPSRRHFGTDGDPPRIRRTNGSGVLFVINRYNYYAYSSITRYLLRVHARDEQRNERTRPVEENIHRVNASSLLFFFCTYRGYTVPSYSSHLSLFRF